jgi:SAM-dependent methyltransferase
MSVFNHPQQCRLCSALATVHDAGFSQYYAQERAPAIALNWWECRGCSGWFCFPLPTPAQIRSHWRLTYYNNADNQEILKRIKDKVDRRILQKIQATQVDGAVLDFGCGFGNFLEKCRDLGIPAEGFEPNQVGAEQARRRGFLVHEGWEIEHANLPCQAYRAIVADDSFCYCWHPFHAAKMFSDLLRPGGQVIMRISNKLWYLRWLRRFLPPGEKRNLTMTAMLQGQFHAVALSQLRRILQKLAFCHIRFLPRANTLPVSMMPWRTRLAYGVSDVLYALSFTGINLYPGVIAIGEKPQNRSFDHLWSEGLHELQKNTRTGAAYG